MAKPIIADEPCRLSRTGAGANPLLSSRQRQDSARADFWCGTIAWAMFARLASNFSMPSPDGYHGDWLGVLVFCAAARRLRSA